MADPAGLDRFGRFVSRRELAALGKRLEAGERVLAVVVATHDRPGVLALTDRRLLFVRATLLGARAIGWRHRQVLGVTRKARVDDAILQVQVAAGAVDFTNVAKAEAQAFEDAAATRPRGKDELVDFSIPAAEADRRRRLERLDRMFARGSITRSEYERSKRALALEADEA